MPLFSGKKNVGRNIRELVAANQGRSKKRKMKQIIAIAMDASRNPRKVK